MVTGLGALAMVSERLIHHLGNSQMIEVSLAPDRLDPAALDMEGDALGLLGGIAGVTGEVYPAPDLAAVPTSTAPIASLSADIRCTLGLLSLWSCTCSLRLIQLPDKPGKIPSLQHVYEGVLPWYRIFSFTSSR
jgi:hypothetical protein